MKSFTRIFFLAITYTMTSKIDKSNDGTETSMQSWSTSLWPFWIYISIYLILSMSSIVMFILTFMKYCALVMTQGEEALDNLREQQLKALM